MSTFRIVTLATKACSDDRIWREAADHVGGLCCRIPQPPFPTLPINIIIHRCLHPGPRPVTHTLDHRLRECQRQRIALVGRGQAADACKLRDCVAAATNDRFWPEADIRPIGW